ncbi:MAG TPA: TolC family protein [Pirellulales bacterium]|nr:TolC family protein [Pirellulales bacterium]
MLQAAPPEAPQSATAGPAQSPPAAPLSDLDLAGRQGEEPDAVSAPPLALSDPEANETWDLTMEEALRSALANSKVLRNLGGLLFTAAGAPSSVNHAAKVSTEDSKAVREAKVRFVLARTNDDVALVDFEAGVRNIVSDVERAYWELYYNYRNVAVVQAGRDRAMQTWRKVYALHVADSKGGEAEKEAQAREQYFLFRAQTENSLELLYTAESRLRYMMGLAATDGRLLRPADEPTTAKEHFDWDEIRREALRRSIEVRRQRAVVEQNVRNDEPALARSGASLQELKLEAVHVLTNAVRDFDRNYQVSQTTLNRRVAAARQVEAVKARYDAGKTTLDILLDAQRRLVDAEIGYYRALVDYNIAILQIHFRKGSLSERHGILLAEGPRAGFDVHKKR